MINTSAIAYCILHQLRAEALAVIDSLDGKNVLYPDFFEPHAFAVINDVPRKDHYEGKEF